MDAPHDSVLLVLAVIGIVGVLGALLDDLRHPRPRGLLACQGVRPWWRACLLCNSVTGGRMAWRAWTGTTTLPVGLAVVTDAVLLLSLVCLVGLVVQASRSSLV